MIEPALKHVIATLAPGIGANTAIFTLVDALLLRPLPVVHDPDWLVIVSDPTQVNGDNVDSPTTDFVSYLLYQDVRAASRRPAAATAARRARAVRSGPLLPR